MPSYPFVILALLFLAVVTLPPLIAALIDMRRQPPVRSNQKGED